ncbi:lipase family protein [Pseudomonas sp. Ant30-3]|uniref:lipase family protein n=1 Tax=Pseudomonas sp. Ant30-3 TaxID=1488328 RepID=UPI00048AAC22|nr:lipase family protein [Pseudomonas sp. Ant30-3]
MSLALSKRDRPSMDGTILACPLREHSTSFQLVDEFGNGQPYAGLAYQLVDHEDIIYSGTLDATGSGEVVNHYCGPVELRLSQPYRGVEKPYERLIERKVYPLPITELQVRAENTRFFNKSGMRTQSNPAQDAANAGIFHQVEVRELVEYGAHLPPLAARHFRPNFHVLKLFRPLPVKGSAGYKPELAKRFGLPLMSNKHHVLEVRPLRALRPMLSTSDEFCALNLYQLALMATLSYTPFGQNPDEQPVMSDAVTFPLQPSSGNWFGDALAKSDEIWQVAADQKPNNPYYPLYEDVPYSKRLEVVPFDPQLYPEQNDPELGDSQENPATVHFFDDTNSSNNSTDTQAFITHNDEVILVAVRGTAGGSDLLRDIDAEQVPIEAGDGVGQAHSGFYEAAQAVREFATTYLDKFYSGQKIIVTGHSLGGAIALLLAEMLRRREGFTYDPLLYTYGAPRAADQTFVEGAGGLTHHRMVNFNDPIPSVPGIGMDTKLKVYGAGLAVSFVNAPLGISIFFAGIANLSGAAYAHHGTLHHFMPMRLEDGRLSQILWDPGCDAILNKACNEILQQKNGLPTHRAFEPSLYVHNHFMVGGYIPNSWAVLRRCQESLETGRELVTTREFEWVNNALRSMQWQLEKSDREARPDAYRRTNENNLRPLRDEIGKLQITRVRLEKLHGERATVSKVYGQAANHPEFLSENLPRWKAHPENTAEEQLAMAPPPTLRDDEAISAILEGRAPGTGAAFDLDSYS